MRFTLGDDGSSDPDYSPAGLWATIQALPGFSDWDDSVDQTCYSSWLLTPPTASTATVPSGCGTAAGPNGSTYLPCSPASLAAAANLDVDTYSLARHIQSEVGSSNVANMAAIGLDAINQAASRNHGFGISLTSLLTTPGSSGSPWSGMYGQINSPGGGNSGQGRWGATSADPTLLSIAMAQLAMSHNIDGWNNGGDDQDGLNVGSAFSSVAAKINAQAIAGSYWVGLIPGLDHWETVTWKTYNVSPSSPQGQYLIARAMAGFADPARASVQWDPNLPYCSPPTISGSTMYLLEQIAVGGAGFALGYYGLKYLINRRRR